MNTMIVNILLYAVIFMVAIATILTLAFSDKNIDLNKTRNKKKDKPIKPVISKDPVIDETPIKLNEDPRYKDFINAQWDEMNK